MVLELLLNKLKIDIAEVTINGISIINPKLLGVHFNKRQRPSVPGAIKNAVLMRLEKFDRFVILQRVYVVKTKVTKAT